MIELKNEAKFEFEYGCYRPRFCVVTRSWEKASKSIKTLWNLSSIEKSYTIMRLLSSLEGCTMHVDEVFAICETDPETGLSDAVVESRQSQCGPNEFKEEESEPLYMKILDKVSDICSCYILVL